MSFKTQNLPTENPSGYCRLCFSDRNLVALFPDGAEPQQFLLDLILQNIGIEIKQAANHPSSICWRCAVALEDFHVFRQRSLSHDAIIQSKYTTVFEIRTVKEEGDWTPAGCSTNVSENTLLELEDDDTYPELKLASVLDDNDGSDQIEFTDDTALEQSKRISCNFDTCNMMFVSTQSMQVHYKEQHTERGRPYQCHLCQADFKRKTHLDDHISSHTGENRHRCKDCGKLYARAKSLIHHRKVQHAYQPSQRSNTGEEIQFKCKFCPKSFKHRPSLNFHVKSHYDKLAYVCEMCDARFANEQGRLIHKGKYHPVDPSKQVPKSICSCPHCPRVFDQRGNLKLHLRFIHQVKQDDQDSGEDTSSAMEPNTELANNGETNRPVDNGQPLTMKCEVEDDDL